ncbi:related to alcohol oxidase [Cephalotrichum gorgonifer]|uniref:Related to alcohol oxidase n=1 Tax=Cephalotrichum gorgonifer TaxID=2041049 RepID=A0AAE8N5U1_9PEZI|nr:related to alcohol oxidase [Cephalotrichum gorgonifer]
MPAHTPDYIIVGGGTSGLVVANRLSENPEVHILVLEAGKDLSADPRVNIPAFWTTLIDSDADWQFRSATQPHLNGRSIIMPQGKALGGSSAINGQAFVAPAQAGIDAWSKLGNPGWDWAGLVPYYKKAYTLLPPEDQATRDHLGIDWIDEQYRGTSGPLKVSFPGVVENPLCKAWIDAFRGMDKITTGDPFSGTSIGGYSNAATVDPETKTRSYAVSAHGVPAKERPNVRVITGATVAKILFEKSADGLTATGVEAAVEGKAEIFKASKEVILAGGALNTPKLLELSGIGHKEVLERHGIPSLIDLPGVGENLQDHLMTGVSYEVADGIMTGDPLMRQEPEALALAQDLYANHRSGPFTVGGIQSHAYMSTPDPASQAESIAKYTPEPGDKEHHDIVRSILENPEETSGAWFIFLAQANLHGSGRSLGSAQLQPENFASLGCCQSYPLSRGASHISSADVDAVPDIDPRYFSNTADLDIMAQHLQAVEGLRHTKELAPFFRADGKRNHPDALLVGDLEGAKKYILDTAATAYHLCGTAALMPREKGGVVDPQLIVYGTTNLRVVDASIFPLIPRGNPVSSVYAVAEKAADIIKGH